MLSIRAQHEILIFPSTNDDVSLHTGGWSKIKKYPQTPCLQAHRVAEIFLFFSLTFHPR